MTSTPANSFLVNRNTASSDRPNNWNEIYRTTSCGQRFRIRKAMMTDSSGRSVGKHRERLGPFNFLCFSPASSEAGQPRRTGIFPVLGVVPGCENTEKFGDCLTYEDNTNALQRSMGWPSIRCIPVYVQVFSVSVSMYNLHNTHGEGSDWLIAGRCSRRSV